MIVGGVPLLIKKRSIPDDYVSWYTMDNVSGSTLIDESANSYDGTINGSVTQVSGDIGQALDFPGANGDYVDIGNNFSFVSTTGEFSITQRFNLDSLASLSCLIGNSPARSVDEGFFLAITTGGEVRFDILSGVSGSQVIVTTSSGAGITAGNYYDLQIIGDGSGVEFLLDGSSIHTGTYVNSFSSGANTRSVNIGRTNDNTTSFFPINGKIDQLRIYDRPLTSSESALIANET